VSSCRQTCDKQMQQAFRLCFAIHPIRNACALKRLLSRPRKRSYQHTLTIEIDGLEIVEHK
jgi:hypothetical protein